MLAGRTDVFPRCGRSIRVTYEVVQWRLFDVILVIGFGGLLLRSLHNSDSQAVWSCQDARWVEATPQPEMQVIHGP